MFIQTKTLQQISIVVDLRMLVSFKTKFALQVNTFYNFYRDELQFSSLILGLWVMVFNATFNNISVILNPTFQYILWLDRSSRRRNFRERKLSSSVLPTISKFVERAIFDQLTDFFNFYFHPSLSAFRKGFGCQTALLKIIGDWKKALDENKYIAAILMDLSKAFDCLPHDLILLKLEAYVCQKSL